MPLRPYIVGNWKMNGTRSLLSEARAIDRAAQRIPKVEVALAPPYTLIHPVHAEAEQISVGAQDCSVEECGAFTGDVSASMIADAGAKFVILGHSERREGHGETNAVVKAKLDRALDAGLRVILCCGESAATRDASHADEFILSQLRGSMPAAGTVQADVSDVLTIAYEPIWAIGTGRTASLGEIAAMHRQIRQLLITTYGEEQGSLVRILYGGSVKPGNARDILTLPDVDGALVGGASLTSQSFLGIVVAATEDEPG